MERHLGHSPSHGFAHDLIGEIKDKYERGDNLMTPHKVNLHIPTLPSVRWQTRGCRGRDKDVGRAAGCSRHISGWQ